MENTSVEEAPESNTLTGTRFIRDAISILVSLLSVEILSTLYILYILDFLKDNRWIPIVVANLIAAVPVVAITLLFSMRWVRPAVEFDHVMNAGQEPTLSQSENYVTAIFKNARNSPLLFIFLYFIALFIIGVVLFKYYNIKGIEVLFFQAFKCVTALNLGMIFYYTNKILAKAGPHFGDAVERVYAANVYEWPHFKIGIRYKIFAVMFCVLTYMFFAGILMGVNRAHNAQRSQLEDNFNLLMQVARENIDLNRNVDQKSAEIKSILFSGKLLANSNFLLISNTGKALDGDISALTGEEIQKVITGELDGKITDWANKKLIFFSHLSKDVIMVAVGKWGQNIGSDSNFKGLVLSLLIPSLFLSIVATFLLTGDINSTIKDVFDFLKNISTGKTDKRLRAYSEDEMGDFSRELARTTALLKSKTEHANMLLGRIRQVAGAIEENATRAEVASREQARGVFEQAGAIEESLSTSQEIVATSAQIADSALEAQKSAEENLLSAKTGKERVEEAMRGFNAIGKRVEETSQNVVLLGEEMQKITGVTDVIEEIATQINLLAFNAQIEAIGSGTEGKRFNVVAEEIRRLATTSMETVKQIRNVINSITKSTHDAVESARKGLALVGRGTELADSVASTLNSIEQQASVTELAARKISTITSQQKSATQQMAESISDVNASSQQIKSGAEEVLKAMRILADTAEKLGDEFKERV